VVATLAAAQVGDISANACRPVEADQSVAHIGAGPSRLVGHR
jgi:hypothetical protein